MNDPIDDMRRKCVCGGEDGDRDREVPATADLGDRGRGEINRQTPLRDRDTGVHRGGRDPVRRLTTCRIRQPAEHNLRQSLNKISLDADERALDTLQGNPPGTTQAHADTATRCSIRAGPDRGRSTPTTSMRTSATESTNDR